MMFTAAQLTNAVRQLGHGGEPFTSAGLRAQLGMETSDRRELTRFNDELRAFSKSTGSVLTQVAKNRYRLLPAASSSPEASESIADDDQRPRLPRHVRIRIVLSSPPVEPETRAFSLRTMFAWLLRPALPR